MPRALITGITGQDGSYLAELLAGKGYEVVGLVQPGDRLAPALRRLVPEAVLRPGSLTETAGLVDLVADVAPDEVYNLAAVSSVSASWQAAELTAEVTGLGALRVLEAVRAADGGAGRIRFVQASSSEIFGQAEEAPQRESTPVRPRSPYGVAKAFGHHITATYRQSFGLHASSAILFNHESPRRPEAFVTRKITKAVARISLGRQDSLALGNLEARRDWGFAGDYVQALWLMLQQDAPDDYVVATGRPHRVKDFVASAFAAAGIEDWERHVVVDPALFRPVDPALQVGDPTRARERLGWSATTTLADLAAMMVAADLERERATAGVG